MNIQYILPLVLITTFYPHSSDSGNLATELPDIGAIFKTSKVNGVDVVKLEPDSVDSSSEDSKSSYEANTNRLAMFYGAFFNDKEFNGVPSLFLVNEHHPASMHFNEFQIRRAVGIFANIRSRYLNYQYYVSSTGSSQFSQTPYNFARKGFIVKYICIDSEGAFDFSDMNSFQLFNSTPIGPVSDYRRNNVFEIANEWFIPINPNDAELLKNDSVGWRLIFRITGFRDSYTDGVKRRALIVKPISWIINSCSETKCDCNEQSDGCKIYSSFNWGAIKPVVTTSYSDSQTFDSIKTIIEKSIKTSTNNNLQLSHCATRIFQLLATSKKENVNSYAFDDEAFVKQTGISNSEFGNLIPILKDRRPERIYRIWNTYKKIILGMISKNQYQQLKSEGFYPHFAIDTLIAFRDDQKFVSFMKIMETNENWQIADEQSWPIGESVKRLYYCNKLAEFWRRRYLEKNDAVVLAILKEIQSHYTR